eukprot:2458421-Prymnesium_polylepis.1
MYLAKNLAQSRSPVSDLGRCRRWPQRQGCSRSAKVSDHGATRCAAEYHAISCLIPQATRCVCAANATVIAHFRGSGASLALRSSPE